MEIYQISTHFHGLSGILIIGREKEIATLQGLLTADESQFVAVYGRRRVGKTFLAKKLAEHMFGSADALIRIDMSEYTESFNTSRLVGAPPGYVGYEEGGQLTEQVRRKPYSIVLLDEIEKAHGNVFNMLLQVLDEGRLTDGNGRLVDFRNTVIIMTSNAGANRLGRSSIGFQNEKMNLSVINEEVAKVFQPEFRNRLNKIVVFNSMDDNMAKLIVSKKLAELGTQLEAKKIIFSYDEAACALVQAKGVSQEFGAREVDRVLRNEIKPLFVDEILFGKLKKGGKLMLTAQENSFIVTSTK